ncbi:ATP-grasp fold amidoligase family protein [Fervidobacterium sp.]
MSKILNKLFRALSNPRQALLYLLKLRISRLIPDKAYLKLKYRIIFGKKLNLNNPQTFNEKLQWLKLYDRNPMYTMLTDKYEVRKYVAEVIGEEHLIPLLGVWERFEEIDFDKLPNEFVLKPTHTSGDIFICKDKSKVDLTELRKIVNKWLKREYYWFHREWPYKNIKPRIIAEKYMVDDSGVELKDYKFMCFNGKPKILFVASNRHLEGGVKIDFYDLDWNLLPFERHYKRSGKVMPKPRSFNKMIEIAEKLSQGIPFVRVDLYEVDGHPYFGELTFYPGAGFEEFTPEEWDYIIGSWLQLPSWKSKNKNNYK